MARCVHRQCNRLRADNRWGLCARHALLLMSDEWADRSHEDAVALHAARVAESELRAAREAARVTPPKRPAPATVGSATNHEEPDPTEDDDRAERSQAARQARAELGMCRTATVCFCRPVTDDGYCNLHWSESADARRTRKRERSRERSRELQARTPDRVAIDQDSAWPAGEKPCRDCTQHLPLSAFSRNLARKDGLQQRCKACAGTSYYARVVPYWERVGIDPRYCVWCAGLATTADHVIARDLGGPDIDAALLPACKPCNSSHNNADVFTWLDRRRAAGKLLPFTDAAALRLAWIRNGLLAPDPSKAA